MLNNPVSSLSSTLSDEQKRELAFLVAKGNHTGDLSAHNCSINNAFYCNYNVYNKKFTAYDLFESLGISRDEYNDIRNKVLDEENQFINDYANTIIAGSVDNKSDEKKKCLQYYKGNLPYFYMQLNYALMYNSYHTAEDQLLSMKYKKIKSLRAGVNYDIADIEDVRDAIYKNWLNNPDALIAYFVGKCLVTFANWEWFVKTIADYTNRETIAKATITIKVMLSCPGNSTASPVWAKTLRKSKTKKVKEINKIDNNFEE